MRHSPFGQASLDLKPEVWHVGWVGGCMLHLASKLPGNVATATESVDALTHTAEISLLICTGIENTDRASDRTISHTPLSMSGMYRTPNPFLM